MTLTSTGVCCGWSSMQRASTRQRTSAEDLFLKTSRYLAARAKLWIEQHPEGNYPSGTPRLTGAAAYGEEEK